MNGDPREPLSLEERELAQRLSELRIGEPPPALDAAILAAARAELDPAVAASVSSDPDTKLSTGRKSHVRWPAALGLAASVTLAVGIAWQLRTPPNASEAAVQAFNQHSSTPATVETRPVTPVVDAETSPAPLANAPTPPEAPDTLTGTMGSNNASEEVTAGQRHATPDASLQETDSQTADLHALERELLPSAAGMPASETPQNTSVPGMATPSSRFESASPTRTTAPPPAPPAPNEGQYSAQPMTIPASPRPSIPATGHATANSPVAADHSDLTMPAPPPPPPPQASVVTAPAPPANLPIRQEQSDAAKQAERAMRDSQQKNGVRRAPGGTRMRNAASRSSTSAGMAEMSSADMSDAQGAVAPLPPASWLQQIRDLQNQGSVNAAREQLRHFVRQHPDWKIPDDLVPLLQD